MDHTTSVLSDIPILNPVIWLERFDVSCDNTEKCPAKYKN